MKKLLVLPALLFGAVSFGLSPAAFADYNNPVENSVHVTTGAVKDVGKGTVDAAHGVGKATVDAAHDVGTVSNDAVKDTGEAVKNVGEGVGDVLTGSTGKK